MKEKIFVILMASLLFCLPARAQNSISGVVFDEKRRPVGKIEVELLDEFERLLRSTKTTASGLYFFQGLRSGTFYLQVRVDGTNFKPSKERVQIGEGNRTSRTTGGMTGGETVQVDFTLEIDRASSQPPLVNEVVFAQNVPPDAEKLYEKALKKLDNKKNEEAVKDLESALRVFPEYFLALEKVGYEYLTLGKFGESEAAFTKALTVNPKSLSAKSGLGIAQYKLGKKREAARTLEESSATNQSSPNSFLFLGKIYRELQEFEKAETNLKKANEISKNKLADAHWELALLYYYNLNRPADAARELELYLKANPKAENRAQIEKLIKTMREKSKPQQIR